MTPMRKNLVAAVIVASMTLLALPAFGCESAGPNTHVGKIKTIELAQQSLRIIDIQMKKDVTFQADPDQLEGLSVWQTVAVTYSEESGSMKAEVIQSR